MLKQVTSEVSFKVSKEEFLILIPEKFRNKCWSESFGIIQKKLRDIPENIKKISVDFIKCNWADPLPLLSLLIALSEISNSISKIIYLPKPNVGIQEQKRFLAFVFKEGFLENCLAFKIKVIHSEGNEFSDKDKEYIKNNYEKYLSYTDCTILPAKIVDLLTIVKNDENYIVNIENEIEDWLNKVQHRFFANVASSLEKELRNKIDRFLKETIENVYEHAYPNNKYSKKLVGCYIRYRKGLANGSLDENSQKALQRIIKEESDECPRLIRSFSENSSGFFEIFVIDAGIGLSNSFFGKNITSHKYPFREAWRHTIGLGKHKAEKNTEFGGLYTLSQLCHRSYLAARDYSDWIGDILPIKGKNPKYDSNNSYLLINSQTQIDGLALIGRIEALKDENNLWLKLHQVFKGTKNENPFISAIQEPEDIYTNYPCPQTDNLVYIRDERYERFNEKNLATEYDYEFCLFLPPDGLSKNQILSTVNDKLGKINIKQRAIIIADIPVGEVNIYQFALVKARYDSFFIEKIDRIIMITRNLSVFILTKLTKEMPNTYSFNKKLTENFLLSTPKIFSPHHSLKHFVELIRTHDSTLYWENIRNKNQSGEFFINENIVWYKDGKEIKLSEYLNFAKTLTDGFCRKIYELALERTLCLSNESGCNYKSIDLLTNKMAMQNNVLFYNKREKESQKILLGSVFVTGHTALQIGNDSDIIIHFFHNKNLEARVLQLLLWQYKEKKQDGEKLNTNDLKSSQYRRIGDSYVIAPYGWKYFPVPRYKLFDKQNNCFLNKSPSKELKNDKERYEIRSVYECSPPDTYRYWQGKRGQVLNIGHINYESSHDILNIDFPFVVNESFMLGDKLSQFLLAEFLYALGINESGLSDSFSNQALINAVKKSLREKREKSKAALILYPFHYNSDYIVSKLKDCIKREYHSKIIALFPVNRESADAAYLISPLTIETLKKEIDKDEDIEVLLFDDAFIRGKTRKEIKHTLLSLGVKNVRTLTLLERRRLPFSSSDPNYNKAFWRLDIPNLGTPDTCPICNALKKLKDIKRNVAADSVLDRIREIEETWKESSPYENNNKQLLTPIAIKDECLEKKFGIEIDKEDGSIICGDENDKIEIINSLGLSIYISELHTMTSRNDIVLDFLKKAEPRKPTIDDYAKIEMLATYLLLFKKDLSNLTLEKIIKELFLLCKDKEINNYTSYALIALLNINSEKLDQLYCVCKDEGENDIKVINQDMEILCYSLGIDDSSPFSTSKKLKRLHGGRNQLKDTYKQLHSEICNDYGIIHDTPLGLISNEIQSKNIMRNLRNAENSCDKILYLLDLIPNDYYRQSENIEIQITQIKNSLKLYKQNSKEIKNDADTHELDNIKQQVDIILEELQKINSLLFVSIELQEKDDFPLLRLLNDIIREYSYNIKPSIMFKEITPHDSQIKHWITWDKMVNTKVRNLLHNANKGNNPSSFLITDPFNSSNKEKVCAWVSTEYNEHKNNFSLIIYNKTDILAVKVQEKTQLKPKYEKRHLKELDIEIKYEDEMINNERLLKTIILFPCL
jgi:hypothetical protein